MKNLWLFLRFMIILPFSLVLIAPCILIGMIGWMISHFIVLGWAAADSFGDDL